MARGRWTRLFASYALVGAVAASIAAAAPIACRPAGDRRDAGAARLSVGREPGCGAARIRRHLPVQPQTVPRRRGFGANEVSAEAVALVQRAMADSEQHGPRAGRAAASRYRRRDGAGRDVSHRHGVGARNLPGAAVRVSGVSPSNFESLRRDESGVFTTGDTVSLTALPSPSNSAPAAAGAFATHDAGRNTAEAVVDATAFTSGGGGEHVAEGGEPVAACVDDLKLSRCRFH